MKRTYRIIDGQSVEVTGRKQHARNITIIPDLGYAFISPVDGTVIDSRAKRREHNLRNEVEDIGNDKAFERPTFNPVFDDSKRVEAIDRAYQMHEQGYRNEPLETADKWGLERIYGDA